MLRRTLARWRPAATMLQAVRVGVRVRANRRFDYTRHERSDLNLNNTTVSYSTVATDHSLRVSARIRPRVRAPALHMPIHSPCTHPGRNSMSRRASRRPQPWFVVPRESDSGRQWELCQACSPTDPCTDTPRMIRRASPDSRLQVWSWPLQRQHDAWRSD